MKRLLFCVMAFVIPAHAHADTFDVYGLWRTQAGDAYVEVKDCGDGTPCGALVWVDPSVTDADRDIRNANISLRARPLIGVPIVWGYVHGRKNWRSGHIYNPEDGKTFKSTMRLQDDGTLKVKGCRGPLCITNIWTAVPKSPKRH